jgi:hypothetical protein
LVKGVDRPRDRARAGGRVWARDRARDRGEGVKTAIPKKVRLYT